MLKIEYIKQTGGRGQYGHVKIRVKPMDVSIADEDLPKNTKREDGLEFINSIKGGVIPQEQFRQCTRVSKRRWTAACSPVFVSSTSPQVDLYDGSYHEADSSEIAFKISASQALQEAVQKARPVLLEPIMKVEVVVPEQFMGDITGNISSKRGQIQGMEDRGQLKAVRAFVPLEMFGYATQLRSMTEGRGNSTMEFDHYEVVPDNVAKTVIEARLE